MILSSLTGLRISFFEAFYPALKCWAIFKDANAIHPPKNRGSDELRDYVIHSKILAWWATARVPVFTSPESVQGRSLT